MRLSVVHKSVSRKKCEKPESIQRGIIINPYSSNLVCSRLFIFYVCPSKKRKFVRESAANLQNWYFDSNCASIFYPLEVVDRDSETQLQVGKKCNFIMYHSRVETIIILFKNTILSCLFPSWNGNRTVIHLLEMRR